MSKRPIFKLDPRLQACADMVRKNSKLVDVGTDHAYLPIWLAKMNRIESAIAVDIKEGPIENAKSNIHKYRVSDTVEARLSKGLRNISPYEVDDMVIAGMGGELIAEIISEAEWLKEGGKRLILQPMTSDHKLRKFLIENGYETFKEEAIMSDGKVYTVMNVVFSPDNVNKDKLYPYIGGFCNNLTVESLKYISREIKHLENCHKGMKERGDQQKKKELEDVIKKLKDILNKGKNV